MFTSLTTNSVLIGIILFLVSQKYVVTDNKFELSSKEFSNYFKEVSETIDGEASKLNTKIDEQFANNAKINFNDITHSGFKIKDISKVSRGQNFDDDMRLDVEMLKLRGTHSNGVCEEDGSELIDEVLENARQDLAQRIHLRDLNSGNIKLSNIYVWGFDSLRRVGDSCFAIDERSAKVTVHAMLQVFIVRGSASGRYSSFNFGADVIIPYVKLRIAVSFDLNASVANITDFEFEAFDDPKFHLKLGGFWRLFTGIGNRLADRFGSRELKPIAKTMIRDAIEKALTQFDKFSNLIPRSD